jgi:hypothetical protein
MSDNSHSHLLSLREAVAKGLLVDVRETGKRAGMRHPVFMSSSLVARYNAQCRGEGLFVKLLLYADMLCDYQDDRYGPITSGEHLVILEPHDEFGLVVLILEEGHAEGVIERTTGERCTYPM